MDEIESHYELDSSRLTFLDAIGHLLVTGGPGSGKTTIALLKAHRFVRADLQDSQAALMLSFSRSAVQRLVDSSTKILDRHTKKRVEIKTYHSFAWEVLQSHGYLASTQRSLSVLPSQNADLLRVGLDSKEWVAEQARLFTEEGKVTYDRFAPEAVNLLDKSSSIREIYAGRYPLIFVDEFQDTDESQWKMIRLLAMSSTVVALGDPNQRIYEWREGVSPHRLAEFKDSLNAQRFDFGIDNHRSPTTNIAAVAGAFLSPGSNVPKSDNVTFQACWQRELPTKIKLAALRTFRLTRRRTNRQLVTIAVAGRSKRMVRMISDSLSHAQNVKGRSLPPITHDVLIDQSQVALAACVVACLMEPIPDRPEEYLATTLDHIADVHRVGGKVTHIKNGDRISRWANDIRSGKIPSTKLVKASQQILNNLQETPFSGSPMHDWVRVRALIENSNVSDLQKVAEHVRFLRLLHKGSDIDSRLTEIWKQRGNYSGAAAAVDAAIARDQVLDGVRPPSGCTVMTMHQLKGREYDGVVLVESEYILFLGKNEKPPYSDTRRLLQVAISRARSHVEILTSRRGSTIGALLAKAS